MQQADNHISSQRRPPVFDFPNEIQFVIFHRAARSHSSCAYTLTLVSRHVHEWIQPILYEHVVIRNPRAAMCFYRTIKSRPKGYIESFVKTLAFDSSVKLADAKPILARCSSNITTFLSFRKTDSPHSLVELLDERATLQRLTLVYQHSPMLISTPMEQRYEIPSKIVTSLTHLIAVFDLSSHWSDITRELLRASDTRSTKPSVPAAFAKFQNLTHVAFPSNAWWNFSPIQEVATKLQVLAVLEPANCSPIKHSQLLNTIRATGDRRLIIVEKLGTASLWRVDSEDCWGPYDFWERIQGLVDLGYISDSGERWDDYCQ
ncbi:hypothetical protein CVT24_003437 [Panaeolus cyanescens]|uniref:F-box domain-containing protein n=1 Tax=Panaeolus cyanescens TaxID=181874 RepID=A0A409Y6X8_9AGAR|nr:hypothetical protein CVT24_003437 [Panaeolus cyanescens]